MIGFGWLGQAHSRSLLRIPTLFADRDFDPELVVCSDPVPARTEDAVSSFGFAKGVEDWRRVMDDPDVDVVYIAAPNMVHIELVEAAAQAGKHVFCEKPVGGTPEQTVRAEKAARDVISGVGYNYRWAPLVRYAKQLIESGELGELTNYRGRFFSMYGSDPLGLLSWRFKLDEGGYGVTSDLLSHSVDLAHMLLGPITRVVGTTATFIAQRPLALPGAGHYGRGAPGDPTGEVTNEDYAGMLCEFANGVRGTFESSRTIVGPESQMAFDVHGTKRRRRLEPREAQRAAAVPAHRRPGLRLHDRLRRRPLPLPRALCPRQRERDRLRGPGRRSRTTSSAVRSPKNGRSRPGSRKPSNGSACRPRC